MHFQKGSLEAVLHQVLKFPSSDAGVSEWARYEARRRVVIPSVV